jgi:hypothetical protein
MLVSKSRIGSEAGGRLPTVIEREGGAAGGIVARRKRPLLAARRIDTGYRRD